MRSELYTSRSGLALVQLVINRHTSVARTVRTAFKRHGIPNLELIRAMVGQLAIGKSDPEAIENALDDRYFKHAPGMELR